MGRDVGNVQVPLRMPENLRGELPQTSLQNSRIGRRFYAASFRPRRRIARTGVKLHAPSRQSYVVSRHFQHRVGLPLAP